VTPPALRAAQVKASGNASTARMPKQESDAPVWGGRENALAASADPEFSGGGFEIVEDDDEDEIIELE
jgi:hypothetical protein